MLSAIIKRIHRNINVYSGISPSLLATMSLSVNIKGNTQEQLVTNMVKASLIQDEHEIQAFKKLDRQLFTTTKNPYENRPYPISNLQNMTDIFTHSVIINNLSPHWKNSIRVLDIGTGHGYLPFLIAQILQSKSFHQYDLTGLDIHPQSITFCQNLSKNIRPSDNKIRFECSDLGQYLDTIKDNSFDVIIGGYFFEETISDRLVDKLSPQGVGIWPTRSDAGQALYKIKKNRQKVYLIETLFSMPVMRSEVSKYFLAEGEENQEAGGVENIKVEEKMDVQQIKIVKKQMEDKLRQQLKGLIEKYRKSNGKLPNLNEMKEIPQIYAKMQELQKLPKLKIKCQLK